MEVIVNAGTADQPPNAVVAEIDQQVDILHRCRSVFPRLDRNMVGQTTFDAPEYYRQLGYNVNVTLSRPMTAEFVDGLFEIGHWLNECFVVRLWAIMESHGVVNEKTRINQQLDSWQDVDLMRRLRNKIGHGSGIYDPTDGDKRKLVETLVAHYNLPYGYSYFELEKYPIGVGQVLVPMADGCKRYAVAFFGARPAQPAERERRRLL